MRSRVCNLAVAVETYLHALLVEGERFRVRVVMRSPLLQTGADDAVRPEPRFKIHAGGFLVWEPLEQLELQLPGDGRARD